MLAELEKIPFIQDAAGQGLVPWACRADESRGRLHDEPKSRFRTEFQRDRDRIIHCRGFRRLKYKTQVFVYHEGDHFRTRLTHSLEVAQIARSFARSLGLNEDLAETCALAHDIGHTPFAHLGEEALDECMKEFGGFDHNDQTLRVLTVLEHRYARFEGLNLTWESLEGIVKHNGPVPKPYNVTLNWFNKLYDLQPDSHASLEAQVAAISDDIAYNNHDLEDGWNAGFFTIDDLTAIPEVEKVIRMKRDQYPGIEPQVLIAETVRELIGRMVLDVLEETGRRLKKVKPQTVDDIRNAGMQIVDFSDEMKKHVSALREFLFARMYRHYKVNRMRQKMFKVIQDLFTLFMENPGCMTEEWQAALTRCDIKAKDYHNCQARVIADYVAGMTDRFALLEHERLFNPYRDIR